MVGPSQHRQDHLNTNVIGSVNHQEFFFLFIPMILYTKLEASGSPECGCLCEVVGDWDVNEIMNYRTQHGHSALHSVFL